MSLKRALVMEVLIITGQKILSLRHPTLKKLYLEVFSFCIRKEYIR